MAAYHLREVTKARKEKSITTDMDFKIDLDDPTKTEILTSFDKITGTVQLINKSVKQRIIEVQDVKVWLEGTVTTRFKAKVDGKPLTQFQHTRFLPDETTDLANVSCDIIRQDDTKEKRSFKTGTHRFPFTIQLNGEILPSSFQSQFGRIQYRLVLYVQINWDTLLKFSKSIIMTTKGCLNLFLDPNLNVPFVVSRLKEKFFSSRPILKANLILNKRGYIPGEILNFQLDIENFNCDLVNFCTVSFVQKIIYTAQRMNKTTSAVLDKKEFSCESKDGQIHLDDEFTVPRNLIPSFARPNKKSIEISYFILFTVDFGSRSQVKGETILVIGSIRQEFPGSNSKAESKMASGKGQIQIERDNFSLQSFYANLPPSYSALSSRRSSIETLPPPYDEVFGGDWDDA